MGEVSTEVTVASAGNGQQVWGELLGEGAELVTLDEDRKVKRYTGEALERNVAKRDGIVQALAAGMGMIKIAAVFRVSVHTVMALRDQRPELVAIEKKRLSGNIGRLLGLMAERYETALINGEVAPSQLPIPMAVFIDKKRDLDGEPGLVVEHRHSHELTVEGLRERIEKMKRVTTEQAVIDVESDGGTQNGQ